MTSETNFHKLKSSLSNISSFKFIHASDIHLGCQQYRNPHRADDYIRAFQEILTLAISKRVEFIILGGDVFTSLEVLPEQLTKIVNILRDFKSTTKGSIPIITIEGNHDIRKYSKGTNVNHGQSWLKFLASLGLVILLDGNIEDPPEQIFSNYDFTLKKGGKIQVKSAMIYGTRYLGQKPEEYLLKIRDAIKVDDGLFHILLQHFGIQGQMENVPGIDFQKVQILKDRVDYLALGHFHLQFILEDWIYNPGSSEAACSADFSYKRGIFFVKVSNKNKFIKQVYPIRLNNRKYIWKTIYFNAQFKDKEKMNNFIVQKLENLLKNLRTNLAPSDPKVPIL
ncbi:MAG: exonuclease SbcCD subunit D, partial [Promethearchaeota archaeon]